MSKNAKLSLNALHVQSFITNDAIVGGAQTNNCSIKMCIKTFPKGQCEAESAQCESIANPCIPETNTECPVFI